MAVSGLVNLSALLDDAKRLALVQQHYSCTFPPVSPK
jgi:hypothetical protein